MSSAICFNLDQSKILSSGNRLKLFITMTSFDALEENAFKKIVWEKMTRFLRRKKKVGRFNDQSAHVIAGSND